MRVSGFGEISRNSKIGIQNRLHCIHIYNDDDDDDCIIVISSDCQSQIQNI